MPPHSTWYSFHCRLWISTLPLACGWWLTLSFLHPGSLQPPRRLMSEVGIISSPLFIFANFQFCREVRIGQWGLGVWFSGDCACVEGASPEIHFQQGIDYVGAYTQNLDTQELKAGGLGHWRWLLSKFKARLDNMRLCLKKKKKKKTGQRKVMRNSTSFTSIYWLSPYLSIIYVFVYLLFIIYICLAINLSLFNIYIIYLFIMYLLTNHLSYIY